MPKPTKPEPIAESEDEVAHLLGDRHHDGECTQFVEKNVCITVDVAITPTARCGIPRVRFGRGGIAGDYEPDSKDDEPALDGTCTFTVFQELTVTIPITFDAKTTYSPGKVFYAEDD